MLKIAQRNERKEDYSPSQRIKLSMKSVQL